MEMKMRDSSKLKALELVTKLIVAIQNEDKFSASVLLTRIEALGFGVGEEKSTEKRHIAPKVADCGVHNEVN